MSTSELNQPLPKDNTKSTNNIDENHLNETINDIIPKKRFTIQEAFGDINTASEDYLDDKIDQAHANINSNSFSSRKTEKNLEKSSTKGSNQENNENSIFVKREPSAKDAVALKFRPFTLDLPSSSNNAVERENNTMNKTQVQENDKVSKQIEATAIDATTPISATKIQEKTSDSKIISGDQRADEHNVLINENEDNDSCNAVGKTSVHDNNEKNSTHHRITESLVDKTNTPSSNVEGVINRETDKIPSLDSLSNREGVDLPNVINNNSHLDKTNNLTVHSPEKQLDKVERLKSLPKKEIDDSRLSEKSTSLFDKMLLQEDVPDVQNQLQDSTQVLEESNARMSLNSQNINPILDTFHSQPTQSIQPYIQSQKTKQSQQLQQDLSSYQFTMNQSKSIFTPKRRKISEIKSKTTPPHPVVVSPQSAVAPSMKKSQLKTAINTNTDAEDPSTNSISNMTPIPSTPLSSRTSSSLSHSNESRISSLFDIEPILARRVEFEQTILSNLDHMQKLLLERSATMIQQYIDSLRNQFSKKCKLEYQPLFENFQAIDERSKHLSANIQQMTRMVTAIRSVNGYNNVNEERDADANVDESRDAIDDDGNFYDTDQNDPHHDNTDNTHRKISHFSKRQKLEFGYMQNMYKYQNMGRYPSIIEETGEDEEDNDTHDGGSYHGDRNNEMYDRTSVINENVDYDYNDDNVVNEPEKSIDIENIPISDDNKINTTKRPQVQTLVRQSTNFITSKSNLKSLPFQLSNQNIINSSQKSSQTTLKPPIPRSKVLYSKQQQQLFQQKDQQFPIKNTLFTKSTYNRSKPTQIKNTPSDINNIDDNNEDQDMGVVGIDPFVYNPSIHENLDLDQSTSTQHEN